MLQVMKKIILYGITISRRVEMGPRFLSGQGPLGDGSIRHNYFGNASCRSNKNSI